MIQGCMAMRLRGNGQVEGPMFEPSLADKCSRCCYHLPFSVQRRVRSDRERHFFLELSHDGVVTQLVWPESLPCL